jgi:hypothetical protein
MMCRDVYLAGEARGSAGVKPGVTKYAEPMALF